MVIFTGLFRIWKKNKAQAGLQDAYSDIEKISKALSQRIKALKAEQKKLVKVNLSLAKFSPKATGSLKLEKTEFLEAYLARKLEMLAKRASRKWEEAERAITRSEPIDPVEDLELQRIKQFLERLAREIPEEHVLHEIPTPKEKLEAIGRWLMEATAFCKEVWLIEKHKEDVIEKVAEHEVPKLIKEVYKNARPYSKTASLLVFPISEPKLRVLEKEAERINACRDKDYKIEWRKFWRPRQAYETDKNTPLSEPHINVAITLNGTKKDIHLLKAA